MSHMLVTKIILYIIISIIIYYLLLQLSYRKNTNIYKYLDVNNDAITSSTFENQISNKLPIIIWNNNIQKDIEQTLQIIKPALTIKKETINHYYNGKFISYHNVDRLFIIARESVTIELYTPDTVKKSTYKGTTKHNHIYDYLLVDKKKDNIRIELEPNDILYVPRYWLFNIANKNVDLFLCSSLLSVLSTFQL